MCETTEVAGLTDAEQAALGQLALGYTDEVAAGRLGISRRTLRRRVREAMDKLGARSRFQAGVLYAEWKDASRRSAAAGSLRGSGL